MTHAYNIEFVERDFPYPIATRFVRLETLNGRKAGKDRLDYIIETAEAITQLLGCIVLAEIRKHAEKAPETLHNFPINIPLEIKKNLTWGKWMQIARDGTKWLQSHQGTLFITELPAFFWGTKSQRKAAKALDQLIKKRNDLRHGALEISYHYEYEEHCEEAYQQLCLILEALHFLTHYQLSFVNTIKVKKARLAAPRFEHSFMKIMGESTTFRGNEGEYDSFMESSSTLLINPKTDAYLNLDPFLVYEEAAGKSADMFFISGMKTNMNACYVACKQGGKFESKQSRRFKIIRHEFDHLQKLFATQTHAVNGQ